MNERSATPLIADVVFVRTPTGDAAVDAQAVRGAGLSPRARQLLQRLDGTRSAVQLLRTFPERELAAYLALLEVTGHIQPVDDGALRDLRAMYAAQAPQQDSLRELFAWADEPDSPVDIDAPADTGLAEQGAPDLPVLASDDTPPVEHLAALSAAAATGEFGSMRERLLVRMLHLMGPAGEPFALRITRCSSLAELRNLFPAILSVIEVRRGSEQAQKFARETLPR